MNFATITLSRLETIVFIFGNGEPRIKPTERQGESVDAEGRSTVVV